jgi:hypothetical protein
MGLAVSLCAAGAGALAADGPRAEEDDVYRSSKPSANFRKRADAKKADDAKADAAKKKGEADAKKAKPAPPRGEEVAKPDTMQQLHEERLKFLRRQQVCDRLREVAQETGDRAMEQQADLLESRAWFIYQQRAAQFQLPNLGPMSTTAAAERLTRETDPPAKAKPGASSAVRSIRADNTRPTGDRKE